MKRRLVKTAVLAVVSVVLLYYNVAWAVLHCPHQQSDSHEAEFFETGSRLAEESFPPIGRSEEYVECIGPQYHTEVLAGAPAQSELLRYADGDTSFQAPGFPLRHPAAADASLGSKVDYFAAPIPSIYSSRYLSLSVLRF
ncbi:MAG: hypothetical protein ACM3SP_22490 [Chloroflexota bacterium]